ncbi:MAG: lysophospholipase [Muribaculaceae bacterium]|nr:lysophospholipase [Muribaculaceae bacterium]
MKKLPLLLLILIVGCALGSAEWHFPEKYTGPKTPTTDTTWHPDILPGYEARYVNQGEAFDGPCRSTIIRKLGKTGSKKAFLYVHGFNDYFFQKEMGEIFQDSGYNFYAVDLRRYGRSWEPWQYPFNVRKQTEYFADIDSALNQIRRDGNTDITLGGHSTGGLTVLYLAAMRGKDCGVDRVVTDSPFIEWNFSPFMRNIAAPTIEFLSKFSKNAKIKQGHCDGYAYSLLKQYDGEWEYNTDWKMIYSPPVTFSWVGAINHAQSELMKKRKNITVPILVMHSSRKIDGCNYTPEFKTGDAVLDPAMLQARGVKLGEADRRMVCTIDSGLHDLILSRFEVRTAAYDTIFRFLRRFDN